jgi:poly(A) polymerase Pap1
MKDDDHVSSIIMAGILEVSHRSNKDKEIISESGPGAHDRQMNASLLEELRVMGAFEGEEKDEVRASAFSEVQEVVSEWAAKYIEKKTGSSVDKHKSCLIVPFGSYCLGVHSGDSDIDMLAIVPKHITRFDFVSSL